MKNIKRIVSLLVILSVVLTMLSSCSSILKTVTDSIIQDMISEYLPEDTGDTDDTDASHKDTENSGITSSIEASESHETTGDTEPHLNHIYNNFTPAEKNMFTQMFGEVIPFIPNDEYYVEAYSLENETGINFYTYGNTEEEFYAYRSLFDAYISLDLYIDEYGDTWYQYDADTFFIDISYYETDSGYVVDVYAYGAFESTGSGSESGGNADGTYTNTDFTEDEKKLFNDHFGEVIPFAPNNEYYVDEYTYDNETGLNFYTVGNTQAEYEAYLSVLESIYISLDSYIDDYGDTWYAYGNDIYYIDICYYFYEENFNDYLIDVYVYTTTGTGTGGSGNEETADIITNSGAGLPAGTNGIYDVDFKNATNVKDVTDQGYYLDGCPTVGSPAVLVIPIEFSDVTAASKGYSIDKIKQAFMENGTTDYYSVYDYYYTSSYNQLMLDITVLDSWFMPSQTSDYYAQATMDYYGNQVEVGDQMIMDEALKYLDGLGYDLSEYDSDNNGIVDAVVLINTLDIDSNYNFNWAYRYWNIYTDADGYYYEYDGVSANDYMWASYQFLHETFDSEGNIIYNDTNAVNTYTYIHEFGHVLGADDYYDTSGIGSPMGGYDVMDGMPGDHNAFTKFNLGWITTSKLITTDSSVTLTLNDFTSTGETVIIANNWDATLGAYQEYYIVVYYRSIGLNSIDKNAGYFSRDGIVVYHVNASLYTQEEDGEIYYDIYYNNTDGSDQYGTSENLIEYVMHTDTETGDEIYTYVAGDSLPSVTDDQGNSLGYTFTVDSLTDSNATITFTKLS